ALKAIIKKSMEKFDNNKKLRNRKNLNPPIRYNLDSLIDEEKAYKMFSLPLACAMLALMLVSLYVGWGYMGRLGLLNTSPPVAKKNEALSYANVDSNAESIVKNEASIKIGKPILATFGETSVIYQYPNCAAKEVGGIILLAHGCSHSVTDFWPNSLACPTCIGLPQELGKKVHLKKKKKFRNWYQLFLKKKFIVLAINSLDRYTKCWTSTQDVQNVEKILSNLRASEQWEYPLFAFGASSGGSFVGRLANENAFIENQKLKGIVVQIAYVNDFRSIRIPILYNLMKYDNGRKEIVMNAVEDMRVHHQKTVRKLVPLYRESGPLPIHPTFFSDNLPGKFDEPSSQQLHLLFASKNVINSTGYLNKDPRKNTEWKAIVRSTSFFAKLQDSLLPDESPLSELMNVAFAYHEFTAEFASDFATFFTLIANNSYTGEFDRSHRSALKKDDKKWRVQIDTNE
ncbi:hypothetical protein RFI_18937, partial [Reticulomyxa filosa]